MKAQTPLSKKEYEDIGRSTLHGPLPTETQFRLFTTIGVLFETAEEWYRKHRRQAHLLDHVNEYCSECEQIHLMLNEETMLGKTEVEKVVQYLMNDDEGYGLDEETARSLVESHREIVEHGLDIGSFPYAIADEIMDKENEK